MVTLREVTGDPEELAALQRIMESDEGFALRVTGHPPGPADAQSTLMSAPREAPPTTRRPSASGPVTSWSASSTCCSATPTTRPSFSACCSSTAPARPGHRRGRLPGPGARPAPPLAVGPAPPPQRGPRQRPGARLLAPPGVHRDRRGPPLALRQAGVRGDPDGQAGHGVTRRGGLARTHTTPGPGVISAVKPCSARCSTRVPGTRGAADAPGGLP